MEPESNQQSMTTLSRFMLPPHWGHFTVTRSM